MLRVVLHVLLPLFGVSALFGCSSSGEFWDRPYRVGSRVVTAPPPAPSPEPLPVPTPAPVAPVEPAPASPPAAFGVATAEDRATLDAVNRIRCGRGLHALRWNDRLFLAARDHSAEQRLHRYMGHGSPDAARDELSDRIRIAGYRGSAWAEVVAMGYPDVPSVVEGWMKSRGHREILLDGDLEEAAFSRDGAYWTGNFGTPLRARTPAHTGSAAPTTPRRPAPGDG